MGAVGGRADGDAASSPDPAVPPSAHPTADLRKRRSTGERDFDELVDGVHPWVRASIALAWDRRNTHVSRRIRDRVAARKG
ncbi:hypothetical protein GCM10027028_47940 [Streptomyces sundarbansensis]